MSETNNFLFKSLNDQQLQAVKHVYGPLLVVAGAGSGKTKALTHRIANLIEGIASNLEFAVLINSFMLLKSFNFLSADNSWLFFETDIPGVKFIDRT